MSSTKENIIMLPATSHGHLIPFLALARQIHQTTGFTFTITIVSTPHNVHYLRSALNSSDEHNIRLVDLPFNSADHGLPPNTENSENLSVGQLAKLFTALLSLKTPFHRLISDIVAKEGQPPLCIISDVVFGWAAEVALMVGSVNVAFSTCGAYGTLAYLSLWLNLPHRQAGSDEFHLPGFPDSFRLHIDQLHPHMRNADGTDPWSKYFQSQLPLSMQSTGWLCNTVEEIEPHALDWLRNYIKLPVWSIGPLLPPAVLESTTRSSGLRNIIQRSGKVPGISTETCLEWLQLHSPRSVLYISFGSQNSISPSQMMELARGLEYSTKPFIWVIRPPAGFDRTAEFKSDWLPEEFEERMRSTKQGLLVRNWAPQLEILSHKSTGAFLSHCGWNSVTESLSQGVPIIGWPLAAEQAYNSKMLVEEMGVSLELTRGMQSTIAASQIKEVIETVMDKKEKGGDMQKAAMKIAEQIRAAVRKEGEEKGSSIRALDNLVSILVYKRQTIG